MHIQRIKNLNYNNLFHSLSACDAGQQKASDKSIMTFKSGKFKLNNTWIEIKTGDNIAKIVRTLNKKSYKTSIKAEIETSEHGHRLVLLSKKSVVRIQDPNHVLFHIYQKKLIGTSTNHPLQIISDNNNKKIILHYSGLEQHCTDNPQLQLMKNVSYIPSENATPRKMTIMEANAQNDNIKNQFIGIQEESDEIFDIRSENLVAESQKKMEKHPLNNSQQENETFDIPPDDLTAELLKEVEHPLNNSQQEDKNNNLTMQFLQNITLFPKQQYYRYNPIPAYQKQPNVPQEIRQQKFIHKAQISVNDIVDKISNNKNHDIPTALIAHEFTNKIENGYLDNLSDEEAKKKIKLISNLLLQKLQKVVVYPNPITKILHYFTGVADKITIPGENFAEIMNWLRDYK